MDGALPTEIEVTELPGGVHYQLPRRNLGRFRFVGLLILAFGLVFVGFSLFWMVGAAAMFWQGGNDLFDWLGVVFALFGLPFVLTGLGMLGVGLAIWAGRSEVELDQGRVRAIERVGPFRLSWYRPVALVRRFVVSAGQARINGRPVTSGPLSDLAAIKVECTQGRPIALAAGYPRAWVLALANDLARRCNVPEPSAGSSDTKSVAVQVEEEHVDAAGYPEILVQPAASRIVKQEDATGVTLTVPAAGVWSGSRGLFVFSLIWLLFVGIITTGFLFAAPDGQEGWLLAALMSVFWLAGIGMLLGGLNMGKRRAVLAVVGDQLLVLQTGIFGSKRREFHREQIREICAGPSGMTVNKVPVLELQIHPKDGRKVGLLAGRDNDELFWLASTLRRALQRSTPSQIGQPTTSQ